MNFTKKLLLLTVMACQCVFTAQAIVFQEISHGKDASAVLPSLQPFSNQTCLVVTEDKNGLTMMSTGLLMDEENILTTAHSVFDVKYVYALFGQQITLVMQAGTPHLDANATWKRYKNSANGIKRFTVKKIFPLATFTVSNENAFSVQPMDTDFVDQQAHVAELKATQEDKTKILTQSMQDGFTEIGVNMYKRNGPDLALLKMKEPFEGAKNLWDACATEPIKNATKPVILGFDTEVSNCRGQSACYQKKDQTPLSCLRAAAQPPLETFSLPDNDKRTYVYSTFQAPSSKVGQFFLTEEEKASAPKHFGMATEGCSGGPLLAETEAGFKICGIVSSMHRCAALDIIHLMSDISYPANQQVAPSASLKKATEAANALDNWPVYQVAEQITPKLKAVLKDIATGRLPKEHIQDRMKAL
ncbi:MAG: hypothetical protein ACPGUZ_03060 [Holosporaceae bacterium]